MIHFNSYLKYENKHPTKYSLFGGDGFEFVFVVFPGLGNQTIMEAH